MEETIRLLLRRLGVSKSYTGYWYLFDALLIACEHPDALGNMQQNIYVPLSVKYNVSVSGLTGSLNTVRMTILKKGNLNSPAPLTLKEFIRALADLVLMK